MRPETLPTVKSDDTAFWIDEAIWGLRLYNEQTPWMTFLEMLSVLVARTTHEPSLDTIMKPEPFQEEGRFGGVTYIPEPRLALRNILFNAPFLDDIARRYGTDDARWDAWKKKMLTESDEVRGGADFEYVKGVFTGGGAVAGSFSDFAEVVRLLRTTAIEGDSNKRWTSKFVFPYGPACLFPDQRLRPDGKLDKDRRFFARTGELVYLMLCRSGRGPELGEELQRVVLNADAPWNRLVERLQPPTTVPASRPRDPPHTGYLPYAALPDFEDFADDLLALLRTRLPGYDVLPHLVDLIGLHLLLYILRRAAEWTPSDGPVRLVLEIVAPRRTTVRDLAVESFASNGRRTAKAIDGYVTDVVEQGALWRAACALTDEDLRREALVAAVRDSVQPNAKKDEDIDGGSSPELVLESLRERAKRRHAQHMGEAHAAYAQAIGLASRRGTRRVRYAPSDQLLKTLVLAVVPKRMEFQTFLGELWKRYRMVIGHQQAADLVEAGGSDQFAFEENARRLEMRLASLGLLRRLSDTCAYVENPMGGTR